MQEELPIVTAMIVVRNEENYIRRAFYSLLNQNYPKEKLEYLIIDGMSEDKTIQNIKDLVCEYACENEKIQIRYLDNPNKNLATGWNIGIKEAKGEYVVRIDAHAEADSNLIKKCVNILQEMPQVACAGGRLESCALTEKGMLIAEVLSTPFGIGNSKFRYARKSGYVDTVAYGVYRKKIFEEIGYFNEDFQRNQDNDLHGRIKERGGLFYLDASLINIYHPRETYLSLIKQAYGNGRWIIIGIKKSKSKKGISIRHLIPLLFVISNIIGIIGSFFSNTFRVMLSGMYAMYIILACYYSKRRENKVLKIIKMLPIYWLLHSSYGLGSLREIFYYRK